jgi:hypothetical protein
MLVLNIRPNPNRSLVLKIISKPTGHLKGGSVDASV